MLKWLVVLAVIWAAWKLFGSKRRAPVPVPVPTREEREAQRLLGVAPGADDRTIREAHRQKVAAVHPDRGGSGTLTRELNAARDLLLRGR